MAKKRKMVKDEQQNKKYDRGNWKRPLEFILTSLGFSVGMGTLWKFPYMCIRNGGGTFLFTFCLFSVVCGVPLFFLETCLGQYLGRSALTAWEITPLFRGIGIISTFLSTVCAVYYNTLIGWDLYYTAMAFTNPLPWTTCGNEWNSPSCVSVDGFLNKSEILDWGGNGTVGGVSSSEEYWQKHVLGITSGIEDIGSINWRIALCLTAAWTVTFLVLFKGVKTARKVVYVTSTLPFVLLMILMVRGATLPGALDGFLFFVTPQWDKLGTLQVWLEGIIYGLYSLGPGWGSVITFASYNDFHNNALIDSVLLSFLDTLSCFISGFTIFTIMGYTSHITGVPIDKLPNSGPGLAFVTYPYTAALLPVPQLWTILFFLTMFFLAVDSQFGMVKVFISGISDMFPDSIGRRKTRFTFLFCIVCNLVALLFVTNGGMYYYILIDWYSTSLALVMVTFLQSFVISWVYGVDKFLDQIREMMPQISPRILTLMKYTWKYSTPALTFVVVVTTLLKLKPPTYAGYNYPDWAVGVGWVISALSVLPLPIVMVYEIIKRKGSFLERMKDSLKPVFLKREHGHRDCGICTPQDEMTNGSRMYDKEVDGHLLDKEVDGHLLDKEVDGHLLDKELNDNTSI